MLKRYIPFSHAQNIFEIEVSFFKKLGIKYVFADLDNTLDSYKQEVPTERVKALYNLYKDEGIEMIITSNNTKKRVGLYAESLGARFVYSIGKPFAHGLKKNMKKMGLNPNEVILIGDQIVTDICSANRAKIKNVLTEKIVKEDQPTTRINRLLDNPLRKKLVKKNLLKDWRDCYGTNI